MLEEASSHSITDIENSITNSLIIEREDDNTTRICKEVCKTFCFCVLSVLFIAGLVFFLVKIVLQ